MSNSPPSGDRCPQRLLRFVGDAFRGCRGGVSATPGTRRWFAAAMLAFKLVVAGHWVIDTVIEVDQTCVSKTHSIQMVEAVCQRLTE